MRLTGLTDAYIGVAGPHTGPLRGPDWGLGAALPGRLWGSPDEWGQCVWRWLLWAGPEDESLGPPARAAQCWCMCMLFVVRPLGTPRRRMERLVVRPLAAHPAAPYCRMAEGRARGIHTVMVRMQGQPLLRAASCEMPGSAGKPARSVWVASVQRSAAKKCMYTNMYMYTYMYMYRYYLFRSHFVLKPFGSSPPPSVQSAPTGGGQGLSHCPPSRAAGPRVLGLARVPRWTPRRPCVEWLGRTRQVPLSRWLETPRPASRAARGSAPARPRACGLVPRAAGRPVFQSFSSWPAHSLDWCALRTPGRPRHRSPFFRGGVRSRGRDSTGPLAQGPVTARAAGGKSRFQPLGDSLQEALRLHAGAATPAGLLPRSRRSAGLGGKELGGHRPRTRKLLHPRARTGGPSPCRLQLGVPWLLPHCYGGKASQFCPSPP